MNIKELRSLLPDAKVMIRFKGTHHYSAGMVLAAHIRTRTSTVLMYSTAGRGKCRLVRNVDIYAWEEGCVQEWSEEQMNGATHRRNTRARSRR